MAKFNVEQKRRRAEIQQRKRSEHGDPVTCKLKNKAQPLSISGKRKRKLLKKWRREQKEAMEKGLVSMQDVEMVAAEGSSQGTNKAPTKFNVKKGLKLKNLKHKGKKSKNKSNSKPEAPAVASVDAMVE